MKFLSIQALRALAAILVVVFHAQALCYKYARAPSSSESFIKGFGQYGVDLFFVLSGFVILYTARKSHASAGGFLARRLIRIVPIYWILTGAMLLLMAAIPAAFSSHGSFDPLLVLRSLTFTTRALNTAQDPIIYVGWTLEYEMLFYLLVTLTLLASLPVYRTLGLFFIAVYTSLHLFIPEARVIGNFWNFLASPLLFEFLFGVFLGELTLQNTLRVTDIAIVALAPVVVAVLEGPNRLLFAGLPATAIVWLALRTDSTTRQWKIMPILVLLGNASYSIYLLQVLALPAIGKLWLRFTPTLPPDLLVFVATVLAALAGVLLYKLVEHPLQKVLQAALLRQPTAGSQAGIQPPTLRTVVQVHHPGKLQSHQRGGK